MTGDVERYLAVGAVLFVLGALGFFTRRNLIVMVLSAEMMLHGVSLTLVTFGRVHHNLEGQAFTIFILTVAACEAGLALSLILALYQQIEFARRRVVDRACASPTCRRRWLADDADAAAVRAAGAAALPAADAGRASCRTFATNTTRSASTMPASPTAETPLEPARSRKSSTSR